MGDGCGMAGVTPIPLDDTVQVDRLTAQRINVELALLREFYLAWVDLHATARDPLHRKQLEAKGQKLVDCGHAVNAYRKSYPENPDA